MDSEPANNPINETVNNSTNNLVSDVSANPNNDKQKKMLIAVGILVLGVIVVFGALLGFREKLTTLYGKPGTKPTVVPSGTAQNLTPTQLPLPSGVLGPPPEVEEKYNKLREKAKQSGQLIQKVAAANGEVVDYEALNKYEDYMKTEGTTYINFESITIWYDNFPSNSLTLEQRKKIAFDTLTSLRKQVESGAMTMKQAGDAIKTNTDLKLVDEAWEANAYSDIKFTKKDSPIYLDPAMQAKLWTMKTGELSEILTGYSIGQTTKEDAYYTVIKVNKREDKQYDTYQDFLNSK
ncbi:MAG: hypothetical protein U0525_05780 [Patescibacteria group bacterium]